MALNFPLGGARSNHLRQSTQQTSPQETESHPEDGRLWVEFNDCVRNFGRTSGFTTIKEVDVNGRRYWL